MRGTRRFGNGMRVAAASLAECLMVAGLALAAPAAPDLVGDWQGTISTGSALLRVVVHLSQDKEGNLTGTMDSPDQGATGIAISSISYTRPNLEFAIEKLGAGYTGKFDAGNGRIAGTWKQGSASLPLDLSRVKK